MKKLSLYVLLAVFAVVLVITVVFASRPTLPPESFADLSNTCPTSAQRGPDGKIHVEPGNHVFDTMAEYVDYLKGMYNKDNTPCIPPVVSPYRGPQEGVLGGLGNGAASPKDIAREGVDRTVLNTGGSNEFGQPSAKTPIDKLDDYEYSRVFELERAPRNEPLKKEAKDKLIGQQILDWANLPFNSEERAEKETEFIAGRMESGFRDPKSGVFFNSMSGTDLLPPDQQALKDREKAILAAYRPTDLTQHVIDNETERVGKLVSEVYASDPNWEPVVEKTGDNKWEVRELRPKPRKEKWADEEQDRITVEDALQQGVVDPRVQMNITDRGSNDPYFDKTGVVDRDNNRFWKYQDFNKWTPGLERMFAPTADNKEWY